MQRSRFPSTTKLSFSIPLNCYQSGLSPVVPDFSQHELIQKPTESFFVHWLNRTGPVFLNAKDENLVGLEIDLVEKIRRVGGQYNLRFVFSIFPRRQISKEAHNVRESLRMDTRFRLLDEHQLRWISQMSECNEELGG